MPVAVTVKLAGLFCATVTFCGCPVMTGPLWSRTCTLSSSRSTFKVLADVSWNVRVVAALSATNGKLCAT